jgi:hypothetical protein
MARIFGAQLTVPAENVAPDCWCFALPVWFMLGLSETRNGDCRFILWKNKF